jgi:hypothetical protein
MFVLAVAERAGNPKNWEWMWRLDGDRVHEQEVDNRLAPPRLRTEGDAPGTFVSEQEEPAAKADDSAVQAGGRELDAVQDDTVFRPAEREAWFELLARVRKEDPAVLRAQSVGRVAYLQLFKQPAEYRGRIVTVSGSARLAYRVQAPANDLGIKEYFVYWLHPHGGPNSPIVVYALGAPTGFPSIKDKDVDGQTTTLHEDVEVTGAFFKRWAYAAKDGTYTAPLVVANVPQWQRRAASNAGVGMPLGVRELGLLAAGALVLTIWLTAVAWKRTRRSWRSERYFSPPSQLAGARNIDVGPPTSEAMQALEREMGDREGR